MCNLFTPGIFLGAHFYFRAGLHLHRVQVLQPGHQQQAHGVLLLPEPLSPGSLPIYLSIHAVFRIRIRIRIDPYHSVGSGSGSVSDDTDPDPGIAPKTNQNHVKKIKIVCKYMMKRYLACNIFTFFVKRLICLLSLLFFVTFRNI